MTRKASLSRFVRIVFLSIFALAFAANTWGVDRRAVSRALDYMYGGKLVALRKFRGGSTLHYSPAGNFIKGGRVGPWTLDAFVRVKSTKLGAKYLRINGERICLVYLESVKRLKPYFVGGVTIDIDTNPQTVSIESIEQALSRVFLSGNDKFTDFVPNYWKPYLLYSHSIVWPWPYMPIHLQSKRSPQRLPRVKAPRPIYLPNPPYSPVAKMLGVQGEVDIRGVVGSDGRLERVVIIKPVGAGLDDNAVETVRTWRFKPATRDGKPTKAKVTIQVNYSLADYLH